MLGPDQVQARRKAGELVLSPLDGKRRARAIELALLVLGIARDHEGGRRGALEEALAAVASRPGERRLAAGLAKLCIDACRFEGQESADVASLRRELFLAAAELRRSDERFSRARVLERVATARSVAPETLDAAIYSDLRSEERVLSVPRFPPEVLVADYERAARQAVLLRATSVTAEVECASPVHYRALFAKLKFRRLLHRIERLERGYRIVIDGPSSLFGPVTKYGLALALVLPELESARELRLSAELAWGARRERLSFRYACRGTTPESRELELAPEVEALIADFEGLSSPWRPSVAERVFDVPGLGVCVPDLRFCHVDSGREVFLEVLGFWSRDAVFRRIELAERGFGVPFLFAVSSRLRVSEELLGSETSSRLYVYKGSMSARGVERRLEELAG